MMYAERIKMQKGSEYSNNVQEIDEIYLSGCSNPGYFKKAILHDHLETHPDTIRVNLPPYPFLIPAKSKYGEKYVRSEPNDSTSDNLLRLPRE